LACTSTFLKVAKSSTFDNTVSSSGAPVDTPLHGNASQTSQISIGQ